jgi:hypothetical protein
MVVGLVLSVALLLSGCVEAGSLVTKAGIDLGGYDNVAGSVHLGECAGETVGAAPEDALWEALATSNLDLPAGSGAGFCSHA